MALILGLTGSIATGKSTVSLMFDDFNIPVVDADKVAREVVCPGEKAYDQIIQTFGDTVLREDKTIDRPKLGEIVFADESKRMQLNEIVHPSVREKMLQHKNEFVDRGAQCVVLDIPLLFESKLTHFVDKTIVVAVEKKVQLQRLMERDQYNEEEAKQRIHSQMSIDEKVELADAVIDNNGTKSQSYEQLESLLHKWNVL
ncbi:dephospho-CoA kinase [Virgibacillus byunsanensis]|uniref:Dephospho-CoA kinase n=1 Tax=Virgibacillus byunsanensis TaxID=570945 RepID=A0ABW3LI81_9BACI